MKKLDRLIILDLALKAKERGKKERLETPKKPVFTLNAKF